MRHRRLTPIITDPYSQPAVAIPWPTAPEGPARDAPLSFGGNTFEQGAGVAAGQPVRARRVLIGGVGYRNLRDMSAGPEIIERLCTLDWPTSVLVEDLSFGAVHVLHWLQEHPPFDAIILIATVARGRSPGSVTRVVWSAPPMTGEAVQGAIAEAVTGVISLDTLLTVLAYFAALPSRVIVLELEPQDDDWGAEFSPVFETALDEAVRLTRTEVKALVG